MSRELVLVGLGNPGARYARTRHNLGFVLLEEVRAGRARWSREGGSYDLALIERGEGRLVLVRPRTYMNRSGLAVREYGLAHDLSLEELVVLADDFALPLGQVRLRRRGSDGGHNGLRSVIATLGTPEFPRLRMGVGPVPSGVDPVDFVLGDFSEAEMLAVDRMIERAAACVETVFREGFDRAMSAFNPPPPERAA